MLQGWELAIACGLVFIAAIVRGFAGFGFSALCVATLSFFLPPAVVVPIILMMEIIASVCLLPAIWRDVDWHWLLLSALGIAVGTPLGVAILAALSAEQIKTIIYVILMLASAAALGQASGRVITPKAPVVLVGFVAGVMNGLAGLVGIVIALFLLATTRTARNIRASFIALFFASDIYALIWSSGFGLLAVHQLKILGIFLPPLIIGTVIGTWAFNRIGKRNYRPIALALIFCIAVFCILVLVVN